MLCDMLHPNQANSTIHGIHGLGLSGCRQPAEVHRLAHQWGVSIYRSDPPDLAKTKRFGGAKGARRPVAEIRRDIVVEQYSKEVKEVKEVEKLGIWRFLEGICFFLFFLGLFRVFRLLDLLGFGVFFVLLYLLLPFSWPFGNE